MLNPPDRSKEFAQAREIVANLGREFKMLIGKQQEPSQPEAKSLKLADYLREKEQSGKRNTKHANLLPQDDQSMIFRKKRDEVLQIIDQTMKLLQEAKAAVVEQAELKTLISTQTKLRQMHELAGYCKIAFHNCMNVVEEKQPQPSIAVTPEQQEKIQKVVDSLKVEPRPAPTSSTKNLDPPRDINELKAIISNGLKNHAEGRSMTQLRNRITRLSMIHKTEEASNEGDVIYESQVVSNSNLMKPQPTLNGALKRSSYVEAGSIGKSRVPTQMQLKESLYQPRVLEKSSSQGGLYPETRSRNNLSTHLKAPELHLIKADSK